MLAKILRAIIDAMRGPMSSLESEIALNTLAQRNPERLDWRNSIVDLLKLLKLDSSSEARRELAIKFGYDGSAREGSAEKNIWLHKEVMRRVADRSIKMTICTPAPSRKLKRY